MHGFLVLKTFDQMSAPFKQRKPHLPSGRATGSNSKGSPLLKLQSVVQPFHYYFSLTLFPRRERAKGSYQKVIKHSLACHHLFISSLYTGYLHFALSALMQGLDLKRPPSLCLHRRCLTRWDPPAACYFMHPH